jgi:hypothetical protein
LIIRCISKYLHPNDCTQEEYEKMLDLLSEIEKSFYEQLDVPNMNPNLKFESQRDRPAKDIREYAISSNLFIFYNVMMHINHLEILSELRKLRPKRNSDEENQGKIIEKKSR